MRRIQGRVVGAGGRAGLVVLALCVAVPASAASHKPAAATTAPKPSAAQRKRDADAAHAAALAQQAAAEKAAAAAAARTAQLAAEREAVLASQRVTAAARLRAIEGRVQDAGQKVQDAADAQKTAEDEVAQRTEDLSSMLPAALRLSQYPAETLIAAPASPDKAVEGLLVTHGVSAEIARQVADLRARQAEAARLKEQVARQQAALAEERARQKQAAAVLDRQISAADQAQAQALDDSSQAAQAASVLAARADDIRSAIAAMDRAEKEAAERAAQEAALAARAKTKELAQAARARQAALLRPAGPGLSPSAPKITLVAGHVVRPWGAAGEDGPSTGITFSVAPAAFVAAPCTGRVAFAAPFRSYGKLMIVECGGGYDFVLAGMERLDAPVGRSVRPGEPLGRMPDFDPAARSGKPGLYVELRHGGQPIDPMPYLNGKA